MTLTDQERALLVLIHDAGKPVAPSDYFEGLCPPPEDMSDDGPDRDAWTERQLGLYRAMADLWKKGLIEVVVPADGRNPDLMVPTEAGAALVA